jgi:2-succinyl-5-enolpyruvyl-6-hydroxy-3-cyclohexene-1-carboxylate synthase
MSAKQTAADSGHGNATVIRALLAELDALGVREFCVCAGARNAPLLDVLTQRHAGDTIYSFYEERSAAFFALGRVMRTRKPVAVVTTSGTAVAELFPAVMEAHYQGLPLVLITADRPSRYRRSGAPQAVEQQGIFGEYTVREVEMEAGSETRVAQAAALLDGPIHLNVCLEEGLAPRLGVDGGIDSEQGVHTSSPCPRNDVALNEAHRHDWREFWEAKGDLVVLAAGIHPDDAVLARQWLLKLGAPVVAEATANLSGDSYMKPLLMRGGEQALKQLRAKRVLRLGAVPSCRWWRDLDGRKEVRVLNVSRAAFRGLARTELVATIPWQILGESDLELEVTDRPTVVSRSARLSDCLEAHPRSEPAWMRHLSQMISPGATVFIGNSLPIREWNLAANAPAVGTHFFANRGANGIDGLVSTWMGLGAEAEESWLIVGDLSALYDLGAPWVLPQLRQSRRRIVVINNGGGKIFSRVSWLQHAGGDTKRLMENPHSVSFEPWARMWGMDYRLLTDVKQLRDDDDSAGCAVWEVRPDAGQTEAFWTAWQK